MTLISSSLVSVTNGGGQRLGCTLDFFAESGMFQLFFYERHAYTVILSGEFPSLYLPIIEPFPNPSLPIIECALSRMHDTKQIFLSYRGLDGRRRGSLNFFHMMSFTVALHRLFTIGSAGRSKRLYIDTTGFPDELFQAILPRVIKTIPKKLTRSNLPKPFDLHLKCANRDLGRFIIRPELTFLEMDRCAIWQNLNEFLAFLPSLSVLEDLVISDYITLDRDLSAYRICSSKRALTSPALSSPPMKPPEHIDVPVPPYSCDG